VIVPEPRASAPLVLVEKSTVYVATAPAVRDDGDAVTPVTTEANADGTMTAKDVTATATAPTAIRRCVVLPTMNSCLWCASNANRGDAVVD
jgi:hypothetical protein